LIDTNKKFLEKELITMKKATKKENLSAIRNLIVDLDNTADLVAFIDEEVARLDKVADARKVAREEKKVADYALADTLYDRMEEEKSYSPADLLTVVPEAATSAKVVALIGILKEAGKVKREVIKRHVFYSKIA
jgi:hypothetical protein